MSSVLVLYPRASCHSNKSIFIIAKYRDIILFDFYDSGFSKEEILLSALKCQLFNLSGMT